MVVSRVVALFLTAAIVTSSSAFAEDAYFRVEAGADALHLPKNTFFADRGDLPSFERKSNLDADDGVLLGSGLDLLAGFSLGPVLGLDNAALELHGAATYASGRTSSVFTDPGVGTRYGWVKLDNSTNGFGTLDGSTLQTVIDRTALLLEGEALLKEQFAGVEIFAGPAVRSLRQNLEINGEITTTVSLDETLNTQYGGVLVGASVDVVATGDLLVNVRGSLAALGASTQYDATYLDSLNPQQTASLTDWQRALEAKVRVTVEKHISPNTSIGAYAAGTYLSYAPQVNYGSVPADPSNGVLRLEGAPLWGASVGLTFRQAIN